MAMNDRCCTRLVKCEGTKGVTKNVDQEVVLNSLHFLSDAFVPLVVLWLIRFLAICPERISPLGRGCAALAWGAWWWRKGLWFYAVRRCGVSDG